MADEIDFVQEQEQKGLEERLRVHRVARATIIPECETRCGSNAARTLKGTWGRWCRPCFVEERPDLDVTTILGPA